MIDVSIESVGLIAPGLHGWKQSTPVLRGEAPFQPLPLPPLKPAMLKPNERRRTTQTIKLALEVSDDALSQRSKQPELLSVFASSNGDLDVINQICSALTLDDRPVSPTQFHNSVHNAPAGYWSIATGYQQVSTSIAGLEGTFAAGLLEAAVLTKTENKKVLLVAYDLPAPDPLREVITVNDTFAASLLISHKSESGDKLADLKLRLKPDLSESRMQHSLMEAKRVATPAARSLPLLEALALKRHASMCVPYLPDMKLSIECIPC
ncbi:MAG: beta-ketoacyl synthase chain length factor [Candidatus Thiodiazotropha sp. (ex Monitilora ramsayi)]|nr:beta-ketoacyl synthase chain length factor [Candidatus Thiodiazotropha sp. (ex Monitilora ramsayi)]